MSSETGKFEKSVKTGSKIKSSAKNNDDDDILQLLIKDQQSWYSFFTDALDRAYNMLTFLYVCQWDTDVANQRTATQKPTMTYNFLVPILRSILGEARKNSPENKVIGVGENENSENAELLTGLMRHISYKSDSSIVFQTALKQMLETGWGATQVDICYKKGSFNKYIEIIPCVDYQSCYWDCSAQNGDRSDGDFCGNHWIMAREDYDRMYGEEYPNPVSVVNNLYSQYEGRDVVIGCTTWEKEYFNINLVKLSDGTEHTKKEGDLLIEARDAEITAALESINEVKKQIKKAMKNGEMTEPFIFEEEIPPPLEIVEKRTEMDFKIIKYRWVNNHLLETEDWPTQDLPIIYFDGDSTVLRGERVPISFVQEGVDPQKLINYYGSEVALSVLNSRRETFLGTKQMFQGYESIWNNAQNIQGYLPYNVDPLAQGSGGKPEYIAPQPFHEGLLNAMQASIIQLKQVLGRPDEMQGMESNAIAGVAIGKRQQAANNATNVYIDNWERGIRQTGKVVLNLIKHVYTDEQTISVREADGTMKNIVINRPTGAFIYNDNHEPADEIIENDLTSGDYDVEVQVSGSYDMQQIEKMNAFKEFLGMVAQVDPSKPGTIIDLVPKMYGLENAVEIQNRFVATSPPQLQAIIEGKDPNQLTPPPPSPEAQAAQAQAQMAQAELQLKKEQMMVEAQLKAEQIKVDLAKTQNARLELIINAEISGINADAAIKKANAGVISSHIKSTAEIEKAHINQRTEHMKHGTEKIKHITQRMGHIAKAQEKNEQS